MENPFTAKYGLKYDLLEAHNEFKRLGYKHGGIYLATQPVYLIVDPDAIKTILIKDFKYFTDRGSSVNEKIDPLSVNLGNLEGERWKNMRAKLSPTFTSAKMKLMFDTLLDCRLPMMNKLDEFCRNQREFDVKATMSCYTTDVIASCIFGLDSNSFENPNSKFKIYGGILIKPGIRTIIIQNLRLTIPNVMKIFRIKLIPIEVEQFFLNLVKNIFEYRTTNNVYRNDFVQMLLEEQEKLRASGQNPLSLEEIAAHSLGFFVSGFEPTSATITFCLHELAFNQDVQDKLRDDRMSMEENGGKLSYDGVMGMKYLDQVMNETLRKYPTIPFLLRRCNTQYKIPNTNITLEPGIKIFISILALHLYEEYFPDPKRFVPERFNDENRHKFPQYAYLPFGEGPRNCIGARFALMQTKTSLAMLLDKYKFLPVAGEPYDIEFDPKLALLTKKGNLMLNIEKL
ncbi:Cytochrome P450 [Popillia japonica]|uniref:Cytochrome P450 n=1 Tax=Popillia japonica TaxID=7064 RepID=A0AAW1LA91_POPJA